MHTWWFRSFKHYEKSQQYEKQHISQPSWFGNKNKFYIFWKRVFQRVKTTTTMAKPSLKRKILCMHDMIIKHILINNLLHFRLCYVGSILRKWVWSVLCCTNLNLKFGMHELNLKRNEFAVLMICTNKHVGLIYILENMVHDYKK